MSKRSIPIPTTAQKMMVTPYLNHIGILDGCVNISTNQCVSITQNGGLVRKKRIDLSSDPLQL